jgi:hypothetical protein
MSFKKPDIAFFDMAKVKSIFGKRIGGSIAEVLENSRNEIFRRAPHGVSGYLKSTIGTNQPSYFEGEVFVTAPYAIIVERGRRAAPVSQSADAGLIRWLTKTRQGIEFVSAIRMKYFANAARRVNSQAQASQLEQQVLKSALFILKRSKARKKTPGQYYFRDGKRQDY